MFKHYFLYFLSILLVACQNVKEDSIESSMAEFQWIGNEGSQLPHLFKDESNNLYISWVVETADTTKFYYSIRQEDQTWSDPHLMISGVNWFNNWADYPMVSTRNGKDFLAHFLPKSGEGTFHYDVAYMNSIDNGVSWTSPKIIHDDGIKAEHGFVSMLPYNDGYFVCWLDGRNTNAEDVHQGQMTLRAAVLSISGDKLQEWELDERVCDCCQTGAAITSNGPVVVYRNRSEEEIRDIYITRLVNNNWTEPKPIHNDNWKIMGCPVNGPSIVSKDDRLAVAWYTSSPYSRVNVVFSNDAGASFSEAIEVNENESIGRVDIDWLDDLSVFTTYMEGDTIKGATVTSNGVQKRQKLIIANASRGSGFPQLEVVNEEIVLAWTDIKEKKVKLAQFIVN